jgi:tetratricopeptide (TPR) repeat protein
VGATPLDDLRAEVAAGHAVVIVGAGVSVAATAGTPTASWVGLLNDGVTFCEALLGPSLPSGWAERHRSQVASGDLDELVGAAEDLTRRLGGPTGGEFRRWLAGSIGKLSPTSPAVLEALAALRVPLATTNYDGLLEAATGRPAVTWRQSALFEQVLRGDYQAILHLHGHWQDPESVVLGVRSYEAVLGNAHAEAMRKALASTRTLVFVGCGSGLDDPNFRALRRWLAAIFAGSPYRHYRLCLQQELADLWREHGLDERIVPVAYGERHDDLAPFLHSLVAQTTTMGSALVATPTVAPPQKERRSPSSLPQVWNVPYPRNRSFTGREDLMEELAAGLGGGTATAIIQAIAGLGGVGKTSLAVEYAYRQQAAFDVVWWLRAEEPATLLGDFTALADALNLPERTQTDPAVVVPAVHRWLAGHDRWLLVFDNVTRPEDVTSLFPQGGGGQVLVTSRWAAWREWATPLRLEVLSRDEAVAFLRKRTGTSDERAAAALAEALGDLPLALAEAAAYIEQTQVSLEEYLRLVQERAVELFGLRQPAGAQRRVATVWSLSLERVREEAPAAEALLQLCAFLAPEGIPRNLPGEHPEVLPQELQELARDPLAYNQALAVLGRYSLATVTPTGLGLHRLVQAVIRSRLDQQEGRWAQLAVQLLDAAFPEDSRAPETWPACQRLLPHLVAVTENAEPLDVAGVATARMLHRASTYLRGRGQPSDARLLAERALTITQQALGPDHPTMGDRHDELGRALRELGDYQAARRQLEHALTIHKTAYGPDSTEVGYRHNELGVVLWNLGELAGARAEYERALEIGQVTLGPNHPEMGVWHSNLGTVLRGLGDLNGARTHQKQALEIGEVTLGPNHPEMGVWHSNLGNVLRDLGDLAGARTQYERALEIGQVTLGPNHPNMGVWHNNLGNVLRGLGDLAGARTHHERAREIGQATVGPHHPDMAIRYNNLATVLVDLGDLAGARTQFERALEITEATLGPDHPNMATLRGNLDHVLQQLGAE